MDNSLCVCFVDLLIYLPVTRKALRFSSPREIIVSCFLSSFQGYSEWIHTHILLVSQGYEHCCVFLRGPMVGGVGGAGQALAVLLELLFPHPSTKASHYLAHPCPRLATYSTGMTA